MACDICGSSSCSVCFHSLEEQERFEKVIEAFEHARSLREELLNESEPSDATSSSDG